MKNKNINAGVTVLHIVDFSVMPSLERTRDWKSFLWDKAQFVLISAFVFVISYLALNYQAISQNIEYQWKARRGELATPRLEILEEGSKINQASVLGAVEPGVPKLNIQVYPPDTRIVIPRIAKNIPVIGVGNSNLISRDWDALEKDIQGALRSGVVHYPGTALPGESGNVVVTGHSSFYAWDPGRFKDVFGLLHQVKPRDKIYIFHNQKKYTYEVFDIRVVKPTEIDVLGQTKDERLTLITCTPLGTNLKRLIVTAKRV